MGHVKTKKDLLIKELKIEGDRPEHIAKHDITIAEVKEVISRDYVFIEGREKRWLLIGRTKHGRFLTVVIGERREKGVFGLVTARPARGDERSLYKEFTK